MINSRRQRGDTETMPGKDEEYRESTGSDLSLEHAEEEIVRFLANNSGEVDNITLISIAVREEECKQRDIEPVELTIPEVEKALKTTYLSNLERRGLIEYDRTSETVTVTDEIDSFVEDTNSE